METSGEGAFAVILVAVERDRVESVRTRVGTGNLERLAYDCPAEHLLERRTELLTELELVDPVRRGTKCQQVLTSTARYG